MDQIAIHADHFVFKSVVRYTKCRVGNLKLFKDFCILLSGIIWHAIGRDVWIPVNNCTPHANQPDIIYSHVLELIRLYSITRDELVLGSVNKIYKRIIFNLNERHGKLKYHRILSPILPSYLQSFNYKLCNELLPVNTMYIENMHLIMILAVIFVVWALNPFFICSVPVKSSGYYGKLLQRLYKL